MGSTLLEELSFRMTIGIFVTGSIIRPRIFISTSIPPLSQVIINSEMKTAIWTLLALAVPLAAPFAARAQANSDEAAMKRFIEALRIVEDNAADPVDSETAFDQGAIPGLLRHLDPHSVFFPADQFQQLNEMESSVRKGFGTVVSILPGRVL